jgi:hypothetical protein
VCVCVSWVRLDFLWILQMFTDWVYIANFHGFVFRGKPTIWIINGTSNVRFDFHTLYHN